MDLLVENQEGKRIQFFGVGDFQVYDGDEVVVFWPNDLEEDETSIKGKVLAGGDKPDGTTLYEMMVEKLHNSSDVVIARTDRMAMRVYNEIVDDLENGNSTLDEEKLDNVTFVE